MPPVVPAGVTFVETVDPYDMTGMVNALQEAKKRRGVKVIIRKAGLCVIQPVAPESNAAGIS